MTELKFTKSHEWVKIDGDKVKVGISEYAQGELGDIVFIDLPEESDEVTKGESFTDIESVKTVSELYSPVTGTVVAVNEDLEDSPEQINAAPYDAWIMEVTDITETADLMSEEEYQAYLKELD